MILKCSVLDSDPSLEQTNSFDAILNNFKSKSGQIRPWQHTY